MSQSKGKIFCRVDTEGTLEDGLFYINFGSNIRSDTGEAELLMPLRQVGAAASAQTGRDLRVILEQLAMSD